jgi:hypothetical protein
MTVEATIRREAREATVAPDLEPRPLRREMGPAAEYPVEELGPTLGNAAKAINELTRAPLAVCAQSVLAAAALATQGLADVVLPTGQPAPLSLYLVSVLGSGERKSSADYWASKAIRERERELRDQHEREAATYRAAADAWDSQRRIILKGQGQKTAEAKEAALRALGEPPVPPLTPLLTCPEPTFEGLWRLLEGGQPSVGIFSDEGGQFVGGHAMNADNRLKTSAGLSGIWGGGPINRVRAGDGVSVLYGRRVSMHLMMQPRVAEEILSDALLADQGLLSRLLVVAPPSAAGTRLWREPSPRALPALDAYRTRLLDLLRREPPRAPGTLQELQPRRLELTSEARTVWTKAHDYFEERGAPGGPLEPVRGFANKLPEHAARLAAVLALFEDAACTGLTEEAMVRGIYLAQYYAAEALRLFDAGRTDPDLLLAERLLGWLQDGWIEPAVSLPDVYQLGPNAIRDAKTARRIVGILESHGWLAPLPDGAKIRGTRRREAWRVHTGGAHA